MATKDIEIIPVEQASSEMPSQVDRKDQKSQRVGINDLSIVFEDERIHNVSISSDVHLTRNLRIKMYTICLPFRLFHGYFH